MNAIGPIPVGGSDSALQENPAPFVVDRDSENQQALAKLIGWDRLEEIARIDAQESDLERSPFPKGGVEVKPR